MLHRGISILLCSCLLAGCLPETGLASENVQIINEIQTGEEGAEEAIKTTETTETAEGTDYTDAISESTDVEAFSNETSVSGEQQTQATDEIYTTETAVPETEQTTLEETVSIEPEGEETVPSGTTEEEETNSEETESIGLEEEETTETEEETTVQAVVPETDQDIVIGDVTADYGSISLKYEIMNSGNYYINWEAVNGDEDASWDWSSTESGSSRLLTEDSEYVIKGLTPAMQYRIWISRNTFSDIVYEKSIKTNECPYTVEYKVEPVYGNALKITATMVNSTKELPEYFVIEYKIYDEKGSPCSCGRQGSGRPEGAVIDKLPYQTEFVAFDSHLLFGSTKYKIKVWIQEWNNYPYSKLAAQTFEVTTNASGISAKDVRLETSQDADNPSRANVKITINNYNQDCSYIVKMLYREKGSGDQWQPYPYGTGFWISMDEDGTGIAEGSIEPLNSGVTYEYILNVDGTKVEGEFDFGTSKIKRDVTYIPNISGAVIKYKLHTDSINRNAAYRITPYYLKHGETGFYVPFGTYNLTADNEYTAEVALRGAESDTEYDIKLQLEEIAADGSTKYYADYKTIRTLADDRTLNITEVVSLIDRINLTVALTGTNLNDYNQGYLFYKEKDVGEDAWNVKSVSFYDSSTEEQIDLFWDGGKRLTPDTTYVYKLGFSEYSNEPKLENLKNISEGEFKTAEDNRSVTVDSITEKARSAVFHLTFTGNRANENLILLFYRERGTTGEWERAVDTVYWGYDDNRPIEIYVNWLYHNDSELKEETEYEYAVGIGVDNRTDCAKEDVRITQEGTFKTQKDNREMTEPVIKSGYSYISVETALTGNIFEDSMDPCFYYKEQGTDTWEVCGLGETESVTARMKSNITELNPATTYHYVLTMNYIEEEKIDQLPESKKKTGTFTTKKADYELSFAVNKAKSGPRKEVLNVSASGTAADPALTVNLTLNNGQSEEIRLTEKSGYQSEVIFDRLNADTKYTIEHAGIYVTETVYYGVGTEDEWEESFTLQIMSLMPKYEFTTEEAVTPESLSLNKEELKFTLYSDGEYLKVTASPETASNDVVWSSDNTAVAEVDEDGYVYACGQGETVITATSIYDPNIKVSAKVSVKNYAVILTDKNESVYSISVRKGTIDTNIIYAEILDDAGKWTVLTDVTVSSEKPSVAEWKAADNGGYGISGNTVGNTSFTFDKDGYRAAVRVSVYTEAVGFGISGLQSSLPQYPALKRGENTYQLACGQDLGIVYTAQITVSPSMYVNNYDFEWTSSNEKVAAMQSGGRITPISAGTATITVKPGEERMQFTGLSAVSFTVEVKDLPPTQIPTVYAVTNVDRVLGDVKPEGWGEWTWKNPQTRLYSLPVTDEYYAFETAYTGDRYYSYEGMANVYISTVTGVSVSEQNADHSNVLMTGGTDSIKLCVSPNYTGILPDSKYTIAFPSVDGVTVTQNDEKGMYTVTVSRKGNYDLKPEIKIGSETVAVGSYKLKAVTDDQVARIEMQAVLEDSTDVTISDKMIYFDTGKEIQTFRLTAKAYNRSGSENTTTKLKWSVTDKTIATVQASDDRDVVIQVKGSGHTVIRVAAADQTGTGTDYALEVRDYSPRVEGSKLTINTAYDYASDDNKGSYLTADQYGFVEIVPVYGGGINKVQIVSKNATKDNLEPDTSLEVYNYSEYKYIARPTNPDMAAGKRDVQLAVTTSVGTVYLYPLTVTIVHKQPKMQFKITKSMNLFYLTEKGRASVTLENNNLFAIERLDWEDGTDAPGFVFKRNEDAEDNKKQNVKIYDISSHKVKVANGALVDSSVAKGTITVKLYGVRKPYTVDNVSVKYNYKKPTLKTVDIATKKTASNIIPSIGSNEIMFSIVDSLTKRTLYHSGETNSGYDDSKKDYYNKLECADADFCLTDMDEMESGCYIGMTCMGSRKEFSVPITVDSDNWREALAVTHRVKSVEPKAALSSQKLVFNTNYTNAVRSEILLKNYGGIVSFADIIVEGADAKAAGLLADNRLQILHNEDNSDVEVRLNSLKYMQGEVPKGTYAYKLTPYYRNPSTGERAALNTLSLKINFTDKEIMAKATGKGKLDLALAANDLLTNSIALTAKFANAGTGYRVIDAVITGDYSKYFGIRTNQDSINPVYYIGISDLGKGRLKAGMNYRLSVVYTLQSSGGELFVVKSNELKVKPVQKVPKITAADKSITMYAAADDITKNCMIYTPYYKTHNICDYYQIEDAYGSIDVNKDGKADIVISKNNPYPDECVYLTIRITDGDAVTATQKGKTYIIPVTVKVTGRDGVSKDASVKIRIKMRR